MMKATKRHEAMRRLANKPLQVLIERDVHGIAERVEDYDKDMFIVFNRRKAKYEIHSLEYPGEETFQTTIPFRKLDARVMRHLYDNDIRVHGRAIFRRMELEEERREINRKKELRQMMYDRAGEAKSLFAKDAWK
jgi:hypothetical protein